jgi:bacteriocin-like protein
MASIKIYDLCSSEFNLSVDSESFLEELSESDLATIKGGIFLLIFNIACLMYMSSPAR